MTKGQKDPKLPKKPRDPNFLKMRQRGKKVIPKKRDEGPSIEEWEEDLEDFKEKSS